MKALNLIFFCLIFGSTFGQETEKEINIFEAGKSTAYNFFYEKVYSIIRTIIPNQLAYEGSFDTFEYLMGMSYIHIKKISVSGKKDGEWDLFPLKSRIISDRNIFTKIKGSQLPQSILSYLRNISKKAENSKFFDGDLAKFKIINQELAEFYGKETPETDIVIKGPK